MKINRLVNYLILLYAISSVSNRLDLYICVKPFRTSKERNTSDNSFSLLSSLLQHFIMLELELTNAINSVIVMSGL